MTKRPRAKPEVQHTATVRRQGNGLAYADITAVPNPDTPMSRTWGPATPGDPPGGERRLDANDCHVIASARHAARKLLDLSIETADLVATYQRLVKCGWLYGGIDPATGRTRRPTNWTPVEQAIVIAELDDRHGTDDWTPAEIDAIRAEAVEILRGEHADPRNSAVKSSAGNTSGVIRPPTDLHGVFRGKHPAGRLRKSRSRRSSGR